MLSCASLSLVLLWQMSSPVLSGGVEVSWVKVDLQLLTHAKYKRGKLTLEGDGLQHTQQLLSSVTGPMETHELKE